MSLNNLTESFSWYRYSKKLCKKIENPRAVGSFTKEDAANRTMHLAIGSDGGIEDGNLVVIYWLVDPDDGIIVDAKFQLFGQSALIGSMEAACELVIGKNHDQARRMTVDLIEKHLRDHAEAPALPKDTYPLLSLVIGAIIQAADQCVHIPLANAYVAPPMPSELGESIEGGHPDWSNFSTEQKLALIEDVLDREIRPYIALDAGGVDVKELLHDREVIIIYKGSCTSCISSVGATLSFIQQVLRRKVHPDLTVVPDL